MTVAADGTFLSCGHGSWQQVSAPFDPNDAWVSYGDGITLHGQGRRNPEVLAGRWTGTPMASGACGVEQTPVTDAGIGAPQRTVGKPGEPLQFEVGPVAFTVVLTGDCLWQRAEK